MPKYDKLPHEVQQAIESYGPSHKLDRFLQKWREDIEARNWLNYWGMSKPDDLFVDFHNQYRQDRNIL